MYILSVTIVADSLVTVLGSEEENSEMIMAKMTAQLSNKFGNVRSLEGEVSTASKVIADTFD